MSVSSVSSTTPANPPSAPDSSFRTAMQDLTKAISSGDTKAAKTAYDTIKNLQKSSGQTGGPLDDFLSSVGNALDKGDIKGAQSALKTLQSKHPHGPPPTKGTSDSDPPSATSPSSSTNILDITA